MYIHSLIESSQMNGPGNRAVVWFQGCALACTGCHNPETHKFGAGQHIHPLDLAIRLSEIQDISGITFSGGEPMHQAAELLYTLRWLKEENPQLTFGIFTGYCESELASGNYLCLGYTAVGKANLWSEIRSLLSFVVMGRYVQSRPSKEPMLSSENQTLVLLDSTYTLADFPEQGFELLVHPDGLVQVTGFPTTEVICELKKT